MGSSEAGHLIDVQRIEIIPRIDAGRRIDTECPGFLRGHILGKSGSSSHKSGSGRRVEAQFLPKNIADSFADKSSPTRNFHMLELLRSLPDDQLAILGCVLAISACGLLVQLTHMWGPQARRGQQQTLPTAAPLPQPVRRAQDRAA